MGWIECHGGDHSKQSSCFIYFFFYLLNCLKSHLYLFTCIYTIHIKQTTNVYNIIEHEKTTCHPTFFEGGQLSPHEVRGFPRPSLTALPSGVRSPWEHPVAEGGVEKIPPGRVGTGSQIHFISKIPDISRYSKVLICIQGSSWEFIQEILHSKVVYQGDLANVFFFGCNTFQSSVQQSSQFLAHASERSFLYTARPFSVLGWILYMPQIASVWSLGT